MNRNGLELEHRYRAEFSAVFRLAHAELQRHAAGYPEPVRIWLPAPWLGPADDFSSKPYAPLMAEFFGLRDIDIVVEAAAAGLLMEAHCCMQDARIDGHSTVPLAASEALSNLLLTESLARFSRLSGDAAALGVHIQRAFFQLAEGYAAEATPAEARAPFMAVTNRAAPFHILVAALGLRARRAEKIEACSQMARHLLFWFQIVDDLTDWPEDLRQGRASHLLRRVEPFLRGRAFTQPEVENALYLFGGAESLLDEAAYHLQAAHGLAASEGANCTRLCHWLEALLAHHRELRTWCLDRKREFLASV